ncbi:allantoin transporter [Photobacterium lutimaris]|uniref:Allantoin permease n=1 Tax=Photobacterium lutimaris TaxID=388278 RepID=A0A2T3IQD8_9GAMM|nr:putative allantoin permease [Photobacterium lutimaris]PSU30541.1 allantoin permease [Photobacterium lutimaris]TDR76107.1 allantoin permease [Photobacterium lutimaris]
MSDITKELIDEYRSRGYNSDLLPKPTEKRTWRALNYFTLWQGSVHNVPNYVAVGGFFMLGLSTAGIMAAILLSGAVIALAMILNGAPGSKYGIPFSMLLRASYGVKGALFPGVLRGGIAAIMWFGLQNYAGSIALLIIIAKIWPEFLTIGGDWSLFGISAPGLIAFLAFWVINMLIGLGGGAILNRFTAILNPCIYLVFGGMAIWAVYLVGFESILAYVPAKVQQQDAGFFEFLIVINAIVAVWAAPAVSASDFTQNARSFRDQAVGQLSGLMVAYLLFAISSVCVLAGASIHFETDTWNVLDIIAKWDSLFLVIFAGTVVLMTTISTNATGNIIPAGYQLVAVFPRLTYRQGVMIAGVISVIICPWKLMESQESIFLFLNTIGGILGPVIGVMLGHYFIIMKQRIKLDSLYVSEDSFNYYKNGVNFIAFYATIFACILSLGGQYIPSLSALNSVSWFTGVIVAFVTYVGLMKLDEKRNPGLYLSFR